MIQTHLELLLFLLLSFKVGIAFLLQQVPIPQQQYQSIPRIQGLQGLSGQRYSCQCNLVVRRERRQNNRFKALVRSTSTTATNGLADYRDFDFSSKIAWNQFYQASSSNNENNENDDTITVMEWHNSIDLEQLVQAYVMTCPTMTVQTSTASTATNLRRSNLNCLLVGCGNSRLARVIMDMSSRTTNKNETNYHDDWKTQISCLDSSATCLTQLKQQFHPTEYDTDDNSNNKIVFLCGDAVELRTTLGWTRPILEDGHVHIDASNSQPTETVTTTIAGNQVDIMDNHDMPLFDIVVDKGLLDALLCGEGWNGPVERLLREAISCLKTPGGRYLLVSYRLPSSTMEFLKQVTWPHFEWDFERPEGNTRVQVSLATKVQ